jgi:hypothetical protein
MLLLISSLMMSALISNGIILFRIRTIGRAEGIVLKYQRLLVYKAVMNEEIEPLK